MHEEKIKFLREDTKAAGLEAVEELIKILREPILGNTSIQSDGKKQKSGEIEPEKMRAAAAAKKASYDDAMYILCAIEKDEGIKMVKTEEVEEKKISTPESRAK